MTTKILKCKKMSLPVHFVLQKIDETLLKLVWSNFVYGPIPNQCREVLPVGSENSTNNLQQFLNGAT